MIKAIDKRLQDWAEWRLGSVQGVAGCNGVMAAIIAGQGVVVRGTATTVYVPDAVLDTDQAFEQIDADLPRVVGLRGGLLLLSATYCRMLRLSLVHLCL
jgi:hypothetical protein